MPSNTAAARPAQDTLPEGQSAPADGASPAAQPERQGSGVSPASGPGGRTGRDQAPPPPWRVEGMRDRKQDQERGRPNWARFLWIMLGLLLLNWLLASAVVSAGTPTVPYTFFWAQVNANNVQTVNSTGDSIQGTFRHQLAYPPGVKASEQEQVTQFSTERPTWANDSLEQKLQANGVTVTANSTGTPFWEDLLLWFGPALLLCLLLYWWMRSGMTGMSGLGGLGQSRAKKYNPETAKRTTFADVAGIDDVKAEVMEIVDFLRNPGRYTRLGAQIPHGILLEGQPGTGKTLLARAVAGEAYVAFFSIAAS